MVGEGWADSHVERNDDAATITISFGSDRVFHYRLAPRQRPLAAYTALDAAEPRRSMTWMLSAQSGAAGRYRDLTGFSTDQIVSDVLTQLEGWRPSPST